MKRILFVLTVIFGIVMLPAAAQDGIVVPCPDGRMIENGAQFIIADMRPDVTYSATAIGIRGFDPVLAALYDDGATVCVENHTAASAYSADLPSTGIVPPSSLSAQIAFGHSADRLMDVSVIVGGAAGSSGEFILVFEGISVTPSDEVGDPFTLRVTPNILASGVPISTYMIAANVGLDPLIKVVDGQNDGSSLTCDDAGQSDQCWGESSALIESSISRAGNRSLVGSETDALITLPVDVLASESAETGTITWHMSSAEYATTGDYLAVFHLGIKAETSDSGEVSADGLLHQWATSVTGSSQYGNDSWSFAQVIGVPDTSECGDISTAWASASSTGLDVLVVSYARPVIPTQINIFQSYNPGAIYKVEIAGPDRGKPIALPNSADPPENTPCPGFFTIDIEDVDTSVNQVVIYLNQAITESWNEIDAVELVGVAEAE